MNPFAKIALLVLAAASLCAPGDAMPQAPTPTTAEMQDVRRCAPGSDADVVAGAMQWETYGRWLTVYDPLERRLVLVPDAAGATTKATGGIKRRRALLVGPFAMDAQLLLNGGLRIEDAFSGCRGFAFAAKLIRRAFAAADGADRETRKRAAIWIFDGCHGDAGDFVGAGLDVHQRRALAPRLPTTKACPRPIVQLTHR